MGWFSDLFKGKKKKNSGPSAEQLAADKARGEATEQLKSVNAQKDVMMNSLLDIQKQAIKQQADTESNRAAQETNRVAAAAKAEADRQASADAENIKANNQKTDLLSENVTNVVAGGTADQEATAAVLRKKKQVGLSAQLGINL